MKTKTLLVAASALCIGAASAHAQEFTLRIQNHQSPQSLSGVNIAQWADDVQVMSGGRVAIEMFYSSAIVKSVETFDAAINGIVDADFTNGSYQVGKDPAFQFVSDVMGGYETPWQFYAWLYNGGGMELTQKLYNSYGMHLLGWQIPGMESLNAAKALRGPADLVDWKFRSPPGMETMIFENLGATPVVIDFTEVFTSLETGIIDGADASNVSTNRALGIYDLVKHTTYPGFHSMPADHMAINLDVWNGLPEDIQRIMEVAAQKSSFRTSLDYSVDIQEAVGALQGEVTFHDWSTEDRAAFREGARKAWNDYATTEAAKELVASHIEFMNKLGLTTSGLQ
ncbi:MAG: TRAP transporter substrate-binding protein [Pseudomonadota bacterium]